MGEMGQALVEYALILVLIVVVAIIVVTLFGQQVEDMWARARVALFESPIVIFR